MIATRMPQQLLLVTMSLASAHANRVLHWQDRQTPLVFQAADSAAHVRRTSSAMGVTRDVKRAGAVSLDRCRCSVTRMGAVNAWTRSEGSSVIAVSLDSSISLYLDAGKYWLKVHICRIIYLI